MRALLAAVLVVAALGCGAAPEAPGSLDVERRLIADDGSGSDCPGVQPVPWRPLKVMPMGDSITAGAPDGTTYRTFLAAAVATHPEQQQITFVGRLGSPPPCCHDGHAGKGIEFLAVNSHGWVDLWRPDVVLLMIGTNDQDDTLVPRYMTGIVDPILNDFPEVTIIAAPLIYWGEADERRLQFNATLGVAMRNHPQFGHRLRYAEAMATAVGPGPDFDLTNGQNEGLHPGPVGAAKIADVWYQAGKDAGLWP